MPQAECGTEAVLYHRQNVVLRQYYTTGRMYWGSTIPQAECGTGAVLYHRQNVVLRQYYATGRMWY